MNLDELHEHLIAALKGIVAGKKLDDIIEVRPIGERTRVGKALVYAQGLDEPFHAEDIDLVDAAYQKLGLRRSSDNKRAVAQELITALNKRRA
jgi:hypothetical protein